MDELVTVAFFKGIVHQNFNLCHHLLTLMLFQNLYEFFFLLLNTK